MIGEQHGSALATPRLGRSSSTVAALVGVVAALGMLAVITLAGALGGTLAQGVESTGSGAQASPSAVAQREIPPEYLDLYERAAERYGLDWELLAAIGKVECDHGRDPDPSCTRPGAVNAAGAGGPMQFLAGTWASYGVDGDGDGVKSRWDPADAIYGAARYLRASGAPSDERRAIFAYNHAGWYVDEVLRIAGSYRGSAAPLAGSITLAEAGLSSLRSSPTPVRSIAGSRAVLDPQDGHLALIPLGAPAVVRAMLVAGNELQDLPYGPDGHPDPLGAPDEDCSSTLNYIFYRAGIRPLGKSPVRTHWPKITCTGVCRGPGGG